MPANNFQAMTCVPDVSLLDPDEIIRTSGDEKISYKMWKKQKIPPKPNVPVQQAPPPLPTQNQLPVQPDPRRNVLESRAMTNQTEAPRILPSAKCCEDRIQELTAVIEQQQVEMHLLRKDNFSMKRHFDELRNDFLALSQRIDEMRLQKDEKFAIDHKEQVPLGDPFILRPQPVQSGRWSLPGDCSESMDMGNVLPDSNSGRAPPDKSQMMSNLFKKYFPKNGEQPSPTNVPFLEYREEEKSIATVNYMAKYKLMGNSERVLDISQLKRQSKLF